MFKSSIFKIVASMSLTLVSTTIFAKCYATDWAWDRTLVNDKRAADYGWENPRWTMGWSKNDPLILDGTVTIQAYGCTVFYQGSTEEDRWSCEDKFFWTEKTNLNQLNCMGDYLKNKQWNK